MPALLRSTAGNGPIVDIALQPVEIVIDDEIDDARHRIGAVNRRSTAGQHIDALQERRRDGIDVNGIAKTERQGTRSVDQHQGAVLPKIAQI